MDNQSELHNNKNKPDGVDVPPTELLDKEQTGKRRVIFNIGGEIMYTNDGQNKKAHIMTGTVSNEGMKYNLRLESGEEIVTHTTRMEHLDDPEIASIPTKPQNFQEQMLYLSKEYA